MGSSEHLRSKSDSMSGVDADQKHDADFISVADSAQVYNEAAFRYFLSIERERSERSEHPLLLVLVEACGEAGREGRMDRAVAEKVFGALEQCVRETDFTGWYLDGRTAGAVLIQRSKKPAPEAAARVRDRVIALMTQELPNLVGRDLRVRLYQLPLRPKGRRTAWR